ncbi:GRAM domain-containing protein 2B-like isoform X2 [Nerophis ophidion]|uniref:GRAM domain-containing protein 2B-like isoform X2 n=1 Tax=Nerophis ophidion TaxID=159077 RepID=UPI002ADF8D2E|nr:GRAM domain-containing protein 2B-like isoform X2 [Nerophis ophidion]
MGIYPLYQKYDLPEKLDRTTKKRQVPPTLASDWLMLQQGVLSSHLVAPSLSHFFTLPCRNEVCKQALCVCKPLTFLSGFWVCATCGKVYKCVCVGVCVFFFFQDEFVQEILIRQQRSFKKHNVTFHKLFPEIPEEDELTHNFVCALQKEVLYYGRLYLSEKYVCFHSSVLLKDTKVVIPLSSLQEVKKHSQTLSVLSIQTADGEKYFFVSLRNREMCYSLLHGHCAHQQETSTGSPSTSSQDSKDHGDGEPSRRFEDQRDELGSELVRKEPSRTRSSSKEAEQASSWLWRVMEDVNSLFSHLHSLNFSTVFYVYVVLLLLLLLVSAYMVLRMMALEEQLNFLGALAKFPPRHTDFSGQSQAKGL